jgi:hypothetical protein
MDIIPMRVITAIERPEAEKGLRQEVVMAADQNAIHHTEASLEDDHGVEVDPCHCGEAGAEIEVDVAEVDQDIALEAEE